MSSNNTTLPYNYFYHNYTLAEYALYMLGAALYIKVLWIIYRNRKVFFNDVFYVFVLHLGFAECVFLFSYKKDVILSAIGLPDVICMALEALATTALLTSTLLLAIVRYAVVAIFVYWNLDGVERASEYLQNISVTCRNSSLLSRKMLTKSTISA